MKALVDRFLPSLIPGLGAFLNPWVWGALVVALLTGFSGGWKVESWRWEASDAAVLESNLKILAAFWQRQRTNNEATARQLAQDRDKLDTDRRDFDEELSDADAQNLVQVDCPAAQPRRDVAPRVAVTFPPSPASAPAPAAPGPRVHLSADGCRLFNKGLAVGLPDAYGGWGVDAEAGCAGPVEIEDVIRTVERNAEIANGLRSRLLAWQAKACKEGWWKGPECNQGRGSAWTSTTR